MNEVRGGQIGAPVLVAGAFAVLVVLWLGAKILRFALKVASMVTVITAVAGAVMYFTQREDEDD